MKIQTDYMTTNNSYAGNDPQAIVVHNTDNFASTATARAHASGLRDGYMQGMSWHVVVDDKEAFQCLEFKRGAWHIGVNYGNKTLFGKINNRNSICVEMCVNAGYNYEQAFLNTVDVVRQLMAALNIPADRVYQHYDICAKNCPSQIRAHGDWGRFKQLIGAAATDFTPSIEPVVDELYRVRKSWAEPTSQTNAFYNLENAINDANAHPGYTVYDWNGKAVYTSAGGQDVYTPAEWIAMIAPICKELWQKYGILASVVLAQTILETGWGKTDLTRKYNILGMKADLINSTWSQWSTWTGEIYRKPTTEYVNGKAIIINDDFRVYRTFRECIEDYENFLLHVQNNKGLKYARVKGWTDPLQVISAIRIGTGTDAHPEGYFTDPNYVDKIMKLIVDYNLTQYDQSAPEEPKEDTNVKIPTAADFVAAMKHLNTVMKSDNKAGHQWRYYNTKRSENTFEKTRKAGKFYTNCMGGVTFAAKYAGVPGDALDWYGYKGEIKWANASAKKKAQQYFDIISVKNKTVKQCIDDGTLRPGDILTYMTLGHTNAYYAANKSFDSGHAYCDGSGEGAPFTKWIGTTPYKGYKVAYILRLKVIGRTVYRAQINAFKTEKSARNCCAKCEELTGLKAFTELMADNQWHVFCGSFESKAGAEERVRLIKKLTDAYPEAFVKEAIAT